MRRPHKITIYLLISISILLSACVPQSARKFNTEPSADMGHVVIAMRLNADSLLLSDHAVDTPVYRRLYVMPEGEDLPKYRMPRLESLGSPLGGEVVYVGSLPEGRYRLHAGEFEMDMHGSQFVVTDQFGERDWLFDTLPGVITDLGSMVVTPGLKDGRTHRTVGHLPRDGDRSELMRVYLQKKHGLNPRSGAIGWNEPLSDAASIAATEYARLKPHFTNRGTSDPAGRLLFPTIVGDATVRQADGQWHRLPTGTSATLWSLVDTGGSYLAGGAFGLLMQTDSLQSDVWDPLPGFSEDSDVIHADTGPDGRIHAVVIERRLQAVAREDRSRSGQPPRYGLNATIGLYRTHANSKEGEWERLDQHALPEGQNLEWSMPSDDGALLLLAKSDHRGARLYRVDYHRERLDLIDEQSSSGRRGLWPFGDKHYLETRSLGSDERLRTVTVSAIDQQVDTTASTLEALSEIRHLQPPVATEDGRFVAFGVRVLGRSRSGHTYHVLPDAKVKVDGELQPYDPRDGTYFITDDDGEWLPFAITPENCFRPQFMQVVADTLVQICRLGAAHSVPLGESAWEAEESSSAMKKPAF